MTDATNSIAPRPSGVTVVIPAYNEAGAIANTLAELKKVLAQQPGPNEIIVVDDGSTDGTLAEASVADVRVIRHPINSGYGRSLITGIEAAEHDTIIIIDADSTYPVGRLPDLVSLYNTGFHMVVAARQGRYYEGSFGKKILRLIFRWLAEFTCGRKIPDINSGFRIFDRRPVLASKSSLSTGFSFTTTITLMFMLNHLFVGYLPMTYSQRVGQSKVRLLRDAPRSLQIILTMIAQFNPLKLFLLLIGGVVLGDAALWGLDASFGPTLAWNTLGIITGLGILALVLIKPAER